MSDSMSNDMADSIEELEAENMGLRLELQLANDAADEAIERAKELEAKLAEEIEISNQRGNHIEFVLLPQMSDLQFQLKDVKAELAKAMAEMEKVDEYLTKLQTPNSEPLNSVNACENNIDRAKYTAEVRNEAREYWASLGNTIAELKGENT